MEEATREAYPFGDSSDEEHEEKETGKTILPVVTSGLCVIEQPSEEGVKDSE